MGRPIRDPAPEVLACIDKRVKLGWSYGAISRQFGVSRSMLQKWIARFGLASHPPKVPRSGGRVIKSEREDYRRDIAKRLAEIPRDERSMTARILGDPLPGRSALDARKVRA